MTNLKDFDSQTAPMRSTPPVSRPIRAVLLSLWYALLFYFCDQIIFRSLSPDAQGISNWYAPAGLSMAVLLRFGLGYAPLYLVLSLNSTFFVWSELNPAHPVANLLLAGIPVGVYSFTAWILRRKVRPNLELQQLRSVVLFIVVVSVASAVTALGYAGVLLGFDVRNQAEVPGAVLDFWIGNVIAHVSVAPVLLTIVFPWVAGTIGFFRKKSVSSRLGPAVIRLLPRTATSIVWLVFLAFAVYFSFGMRNGSVAPTFYPCFVPLILAAFWRGIKGAATGVFFVCAGTSLYATATYAWHTPNDIQLFLIALSLTSLLLGAAVSESRRSTRDAQAVHEFYRQAITAARAVPYVRDYHHDTFTYIGDGIERVTGYTAGEFTTKLWEQRSTVVMMHGDAQAMAIDEAIQRTRAGEFKTWSSEGRFHARDGSMRWVLDASVEIFGEDGLPVRSIGLIQDMSQYRRTELALRASEQQKALILSSLPVCFYTGKFDGSKFITKWVSGSVESLTGFPPSEFLGESTLWFRRVHPDDAEAVSAELASVVKRGRAAAEYRWQCADGSYRWFWNQPVQIPADSDRPSQVVGIWLDITERKRAEEALKNSRAVLYSFVEHTPAAVAMLDKELRYMAVSRRWVQDYRLGEQQIIGKGHYDIFPEIRENAAWRSVHQRCLEGAVERAEEDSFMRADGTEDWLRWEVRPWYAEDGTIGGIIMFTELVTERKRAQEELRQSQERLDLALKGADLGLWDLDIAGGMLEVSERWAEMFGFTLETVPRESGEWYERTHQDDANRLIEHFWRHIGGEIPLLDAEVRFRARNGDWVWVNLRGKVAERDSGGVPLRIAGTLFDISGRKAAEVERWALEAQMQHAQKLESLGVLAGGIAHDFNNLLVGILGNADLALLDLAAQSPVRDGIEDIVTSAQRAADLCKQMLAYSGRGRFVVAPIALNDLVREMHNLLAVSVSKRVAVVFEPTEDLPLVRADATQIRQIVMNLLTNASEAIGDAEGMIRVTTELVVWTRTDATSLVGIDLIRGKRYVCLRIVDTGCGMDLATQARIFDPFFTTKFTGRGLGMAAVLGIVRGHEGAIRVESQPNAGSIFTVYLPAMQGEAPAPTLEVAPPPALRGEGLVLVVDDEQPVLDIAKAMLERRGFAVVTAHDGREALDAFEQQKDAFTLAIVDLTMPRMSGGDLVNELHRMKPGLCVVLSSGYNEQEAVEQTHGKKMGGFIQKPYRAKEFYAVVQRALDGHRNGD
ncbi:MAG: PAS domain-containing protein [Candidatus Hydrogenedentes bacterium]|nr:PAS domain-containing protein [Candidatus Hydrogenedentota bacterium]